MCASVPIDRAAMTPIISVGSSGGNISVLEVWLPLALHACSYELASCLKGAGSQICQSGAAMLYYYTKFSTARKCLLCKTEPAPKVPRLTGMLTGTCPFLHFGTFWHFLQFLYFSPFFFQKQARLFNECCFLLFTIFFSTSSFLPSFLAADSK